jgi:hypothetical protein
MQGLRSRAGIVAMTAGAFALLSVPVVALAKGPPDQPGGGTDTATSVAAPQAQIPNPPPGQANQPAAARPAPAPKPAAPGRAKRVVQVSAPATTGDGGGSASHRRGASKSTSPSRGTPPAHAKAFGRAKVPPGHSKGSHEPAEGSSDPGQVSQPDPARSPDKPSRRDSKDELDPSGPLDLPSADAPESSDDDGGVDAAVVGDTVEIPEDASPETLPFTGIQLGLLTLIGLASLAGGFMLRRGAPR